MLPRTGSTLSGALEFSPGIVPARARAPLSACAEPCTGVTSAPTSATANHLPGIAGSLARGRGLGWRRHRFQLLAVLGIHRLGTAARGVERNPIVHAEFMQIRVGPGQEMRNHASWTIDFGDNTARIRRDLLM